MKAKNLFAAAFAAIALGSGAHAVPVSETVYFRITGETLPTITFSLPRSPTPDDYTPGQSFEIDNVAIKVNGSPDGTDGFLFFSASNGGGLSDFDFFGYPFNPGIFGPLLYSGTEANPTFLYGLFHGEYFIVETDPHATIAISSTPLPAALPLFAGGLGALGLGAWRRKRKKAASVAA